MTDRTERHIPAAGGGRDDEGREGMPGGTA